MTHRQAGYVHLNCPVPLEGALPWHCWPLPIRAMPFGQQRCWCSMCAYDFGATQNRQVFRVVVLHSLLLLMGGLVFGAYLTLPMWVEMDNAGLQFGTHLSWFPDPAWEQLLVWSNYRFRIFYIETNHWYGGYLGLSVVGLASAGLLWGRTNVPAGHSGRRRRKGRRRQAQAGAGRPVAVAACLIASLILVFGYRWPLLRSLNIVQAFNAGRYLLFVVFFLAVMAGVGTLTLIRLRVIQGKGSNVFTLLLLAVMVDLGPTTFQHPYPTTTETPILFPSKLSNYLKMTAARYANGELPNYRIFYATGNIWRFLAISWPPLETDTPSFLSHYNERPLATFAFGQPLENLLNSAIGKVEKEIENVENPKKSIPLPPIEDFGLLADGLFLLNTKYFFARHSNKKMFLPWTMPPVSPVVVSPRVAEWDHPLKRSADTQTQEALLRLLKATGVNAEENTCDQILLTGYEGREDLGTSPSVEVLEHRVWNQRVEMRIRTSSPCFARLSYAYYPHLRVTVNGQEVAPLQTAGRFIALRLSGGEHQIVLDPVLSPLRRGLLTLNLVLLAAAAFAWVYTRRTK